jgi:hypothetical protein
LYNFAGTGTVSNVVAGVLMDIDELPAARYGTVQTGVYNQNGGDITRNLVWQQGTDTAGHVANPAGYTAERYRGGAMLVEDPAATGAFFAAKVGNNVQEIQPGSGPSSEWLYRQLVTLSGINLPTLPDTDMYTLMSLARGVAPDPIHTPRLVVAYLSDTISQGNFDGIATKASAYAGYLKWKTERCTCAPKHADPSPVATADGIINVNDVVQAVNVAFRNAAALTNPPCTYDRTDVSCDGVTTVTDVVKFVNVAFRGARPVDNFCCP